MSSPNGQPERWIIVNRWEEFQHRDMARSRTPPWIKVWTRLLSDDAYMNLTMAQRGLLHDLWILYARSRRVVSESGASRQLVGNASDAKYFRKNLAALNHAGFISFSASKPASKVARNLPALEVEVEIEARAVTALRPQDAPAREQPSHEADELHPLVAAIAPQLEPIP